VNKRFRILIINPKTTSTNICIFHNEVCIFKETIHHETSMNNLSEIDQVVSERKKEILQILNDSGINMSRLHAVCSNGGLIRHVEGGTYFVNEHMLTDLRNNFNGIHSSNLGGVLASEIANGLNIPAYIVDPPVVNELIDIATCTGLPGIERKSIFHALNQKYVARKTAAELEKKYETTNLIVAHIGLGITIGAHQCGKVIDVNNGLHGDGPFSIERAGTIPSEGLIALCYSGVFTQEEIVKEITYNGGLKAYLHTDNIEEIEKRIHNNDPLAKHIFEAMAYQIAKEIGSMATVLKGSVDGVVLTGHLSHSKLLTTYIMDRVNWIADVFIYPGEYDIQALNEGVLRVLRNEETSKIYHKNDEGEKII